MSLDRQGPYRARHLVWPWASNQSGAGAGTHLAWLRCRGAYRCMGALPLRHLAITPRINRRRDAGGGISCAVGDSGPPRDGREPSWARPCEASGALFLSNGGSGGGHETCTLWPPPAPFGYFPVWESTSSARRRTKPPTRNRFLVEGKGKEPSLLSSVSQKVSPLRRRPGGFPLAPWTPSGVHLLQTDETSHKEQVSCARQGKGPILLFPYHKRFRLCGGDQRAFRSPFGNLRTPYLLKSLHDKKAEILLFLHGKA